MITRGLDTVVYLHNSTRSYITIKQGRKTQKSLNYAMGELWIGVEGKEALGLELFSASSIAC